jgi:hypothetical protein
MISLKNAAPDQYCEKCLNTPNYSRIKVQTIIDNHCYINGLNFLLENQFSLFQEHIIKMAKNYFEFSEYSD